jgi:hypothetical protein
MVIRANPTPARATASTKAFALRAGVAGGALALVTFAVGAGCAFDAGQTDDGFGGATSALDARDLARGDHPGLVAVDAALDQGAASDCHGLVQPGDVVVRSNHPGLVVVMHVDVPICVDDSSDVAAELRDRRLQAFPDELQRVFVVVGRVAPVVEVRAAGDPSPQPSSPGPTDSGATPPQGSMQTSAGSGSSNGGGSSGVGVGGTKGDPSPQPSDRNRPVEGEPSPQPSQPIRIFWSI